MVAARVATDMNLGEPFSEQRHISGALSSTNTSNTHDCQLALDASMDDVGGYTPSQLMPATIGSSSGGSPQESGQPHVAIQPSTGDSAESAIYLMESVFQPLPTFDNGDGTSGAGLDPNGSMPWAAAPLNNGTYLLADAPIQMGHWHNAATGWNTAPNWNGGGDGMMFLQGPDATLDGATPVLDRFTAEQDQFLYEMKRMGKTHKAISREMLRRFGVKRNENVLSKRFNAIRKHHLQEEVVLQALMHAQPRIHTCLLEALKAKISPDDPSFGKLQAEMEKQLPDILTRLADKMLTETSRL